MKGLCLLRQGSASLPRFPERQGRVSLVRLSIPQLQKSIKRQSPGEDIDKQRTTRWKNWQHNCLRASPERRPDGRRTARKVCAVPLAPGTQTAAAGAVPSSDPPRRPPGCRPRWPITRPPFPGELPQAKQKPPGPNSQLPSVTSWHEARAGQPASSWDQLWVTRAVQSRAPPWTGADQLLLRALPLPAPSSVPAS